MEVSFVEGARVDALCCPIDDKKLSTDDNESVVIDQRYRYH